MPATAEQSNLFQSNASQMRSQYTFRAHAMTFRAYHVQQSQFLAYSVHATRVGFSWFLSGDASNCRAKQPVSEQCESNALAIYIPSTCNDFPRISCATITVPCIFGARDSRRIFLVSE